MRDLLGRESNAVLLDEFEKVNHSLYNVFYQQFDEGLFIDTNYKVNIIMGLKRPRRVPTGRVVS